MGSSPATAIDAEDARSKQGNAKLPHSSRTFERTDAEAGSRCSSGLGSTTTATDTEDLALLPSFAAVEHSISLPTDVGAREGWGLVFVHLVASLRVDFCWLQP